MSLDFGTTDATPPSFRWWEGDTREVVRATTVDYELKRAGRYFAEVTDEATGCTALDSIDVSQVVPFTTREVAALALNCAQSDTVATVELDNPDGIRVGYAWSVVTGGAVIEGAAAATARLTPGTYEVAVRDLDGDCTQRETVVIDPYVGWVATAEADALYDDCQQALTLSGTPSDTMASRWTLLGGDLPEFDPASPLQTILDAEVGTYELTYELVPDFCPPSAPVPVTIEVTPQPRINLFDASGRSGPRVRDTTIQLIPSSVDDLVATLDSVSGEATVTINASNRMGIRGWTGDQLEVRYEVCDRFCATRCKTVRYILVRGDGDADDGKGITELPNTITPNNDGRNDRFVVEALVQDPSRYPNARLTVINRWGSVLYTAQPYANDFDGRDSDGADIPEGTYYFVLELDIVNDEVLKGSLTILR